MSSNKARPPITRLYREGPHQNQTTKDIYLHRSQSRHVKPEPQYLASNNDNDKYADMLRHYDGSHCRLEEAIVPVDGTTPLAISDARTMSKQHYVLLPLGKTGDGKSSLLNTLFESSIFHAKFGARSVTSTVTECTGIWRLDNNSNSECLITVADTPGFADSEGRDSAFKGQLQDYIRDVSIRLGIDAFLLVFQYTSNQVMKVIRAFAQVMETMEPKTWWDHTILVFTHVDFGKRSSQQVSDRKINIKNKLARQIQEEFGLKQPPSIVFFSSNRTCALDVGNAAICECNLINDYISERMRQLRSAIADCHTKGRWVAKQ
ncbi:P-loop containing nucleoside triphosphate hydrolase protein [Radiomyces spectabilis]|uniref:P-loop containing nucleoside triphosphate hydrolase protein n=1 Tax=Radiomyces spectabilis TaxID=64574 RepID=UPI0022201B38|nr:P-loop containing nucleoside triphosphate hydrolase protein [Radiomyces spectabilis]KAI8367507.1 P-loop containing nucleoside triphosphate hydrolase protein [Radiomyces spectabilis]